LERKERVEKRGAKEGEKRRRGGRGKETGDRE